MPPQPPAPVRARRLLSGAVLLAAAAALLAPAPAAPAAVRGPVNPLTRHVSALQVGPGHEFRLVVLHPLHAPDTFKAPDDLRLAQTALADTVGFRAPSGGRTRPLRIDNLIERRLLVLPGQIMRSDRFDMAFTDYVVVRGRSGTEAPLELVSTAASRDEPRPERRVLPDWLPPTLRFAVGPDAPHGDLDRTLSEWADLAGLEGPRTSMADLARGENVKERAAEYERALGVLARAPAGLQTVGYAAVLDGEPLVVETFADGKTFTELWGSLARALAAEAAVVEAREDLLETDMAPTGEPDRFLAPVRELLLGFYRDEPEQQSVRETGKRYEVDTPVGTVRALVLGPEEFVHAVLVTDPRRRSDSEAPDFDPGAISRKARPTQAEERWLDRRKNRQPPIPGEQPKPPGPKPDTEFPPR